MLEYVHMLNNTSDMLDDVFEGNMKVAKFDYRFIKQNKKQMSLIKRRLGFRCRITCLNIMLDTCTLNT